MCAVLGPFILPPVLLAQTRDLANLRGRVVDPSAAAVAGAEVTVENVSTGLTRETRTDPAGEYSFLGLPLTGQYTVSVRKAQFNLVRQQGIELRAGETATLDFTLSLSGATSSVTVYGTADSVATDSSQLGARLDFQVINRMPLLGRKLSSLALLDSAVRPARGTGDQFLSNTLFVIHGSGRRQTTFSVDNSTGDDSWGRQALFTSIPYSAVQEFTILTNASSAEYGRTTGSAINVVTKSGTNVFHGDLVALWRPAALEARMPLAPSHTGDALRQLSGAFSGPIVEDRTHFLLAAEYNNQDRDSVFATPLSSGIFAGAFRQGMFLARVDHQINSRNALMARINFDRFSDSNPADAVGGLTLPSAARTFRRRTYAAQLSETAVLGNSALNEARFQFQLGSPITQFEPVSPSTQFVRPGRAVEGESRSASLRNHQYQVADTYSRLLGRHTLKAGTEFIVSSSGGFGQEFGSGFVLGQFRVNPVVTSPISKLTLADVTDFTQSFGNASYHVTETLFALFVQDDFQVRPGLTLNLGLRYDRQDFTDANRNFSPRVGFAYLLPARRPTVLRGGYGIYYSEIRANLAANFQLNGPTGIFTFSARPGEFGFPTTLGPLPVFPPGAILPARDITVRPGERAFLSKFFDVSKLRSYPDRLLNPYTQQWNFGIEHDLGHG